MFRILTALVGLAAVGLAWQQEDVAPFRHLKEEQITVEYTATANEATIRVQAESEEPLNQVQVCNRFGVPLFELRSEAGADLALSSFVLESGETELEDLLSRYEAGAYELRGRTVGGSLALGGVRLSHALPAPPRVIWPRNGSTPSATNFVIRWEPEPGAKAYRVAVEQGETDGIVATVPAGFNRFKVPVGILQSGMETQVEVGVVAQNGNCTLVEIECVTQ